MMNWIISITASGLIVLWVFWICRTVRDANRRADQMCEIGDRAIATFSKKEVAEIIVNHVSKFGVYVIPDQVAVWRQNGSTQGIKIFTMEDQKLLKELQREV